MDIFDRLLGCAVEQGCRHISSGRVTRVIVILSGQNGGSSSRTSTFVVYNIQAICTIRKILVRVGVEGTYTRSLSE